ncbi:MAG: phosphotransferase family protein [Pseudomonadota bacterium]
MATAPTRHLADHADLIAAVRRRLGAGVTVANIDIPTLGGVNRTILFDVVDKGTTKRYVSRQETYVDPDSPFLATGDQFRAMRIAFEHGLPVPEPIFEYDASDGMGNGFVTAFAAGETMPKRIQKDPDFLAVRPRLVADAAGILARIHALPSQSFGFLAERPDSADTVSAHRDLYDGYRQARPAIEAGFRWLERNRPSVVDRVFLHGDFRLGNLMIDGTDGISAVLDWECAHLGQPAEDLGWLCTRSWRFSRPDLPAAGLASRQELLDAYSAAGGRSYDADEIRYWEIFGLVRFAVLNLMQNHGHVSGQRRGLVYAACGRNTALVEYDLLMTLAGRYE